MTFSLSEMLAQRADLTPHHPAFVGGSDRFTFAEVDRRCDRASAWLRARRCVPGERVAVLARNSVGMAEAIFAASRADAVVVVLNWRLHFEELAFILKDCGATLLIYDAAFEKVAEDLRVRSAVETLLCLGPSVTHPTFANAIADPGISIPPVSLRTGSDTAIILYTSGTTGRPKGAMLTHDNFLWAAHGTSCTIEMLASHRFLFVAPIFHIAGLMPLVTGVQKGSTAFFLAEFDPATVWKVIERERITTSMLVPAMLVALLAAKEGVAGDASSLCYLSCGASAVPPALIEAWWAHGVQIHQVYGLTEVTGSLSYWKRSMGAEKARSQGRPVFLSRVRIVDPATGTTVPANTPGEVMCRGATVFAGYWNDCVATQSAMRDGWFATGDIGYFDEDGFLYLVDRLKDLIISGGENVYPAELETVIAALDGVAEVAVVGRADARWGEVPVAFVVGQPHAELSEESVLEVCRTNLARFKHPRGVIFLDALPRNGIGKITRPALRQMLSNVQS